MGISRTRQRIWGQCKFLEAKFPEARGYSIKLSPNTGSTGLSIRDSFF